MKGFLSWVKDQSGEEHNSYDERGRVEWVVKQIGANHFFTEMAYDSMDRVTKLMYPDQSSITYNYNSRGLLGSVPNVIDRYEYNPSGQNAKLALACGTESVYTYDHRLRLKNLNTGRIRDSLMLQDLHYAFDNVSNITGIQDNRADAALDTIGSELGIASAQARKFNSAQSFVYDSLYRLTNAANAGIYGTINYRYDRIGNMISKNASLINPDPLMDLGTMTCGGNLGTKNRMGRNAGDAPGPHAITGTEKGVSGAMTFAYDDNGNMVSDNGMILSWDFKDRLASLKKGTVTADYLYDYSDTRKKKTLSSSDGSTSEVVYVDKYSEVRNGKLIKYVYAGNSRIARAENGCGGSAALIPTAFYLHDHLGSTSLSLSDNGTVTEQLVNYPYGNPRMEQRAASAISGADYKFTGKERDLESGLQYFESRYLENSLGRFISVDPLVGQMGNNNLIIPQSLNLYAYAKDNPLNYIDPDGEKFVADTFATIKEIGHQFKDGNLLNIGRIALGYPISILSGDIFDPNACINKNADGIYQTGIRTKPQTTVEAAHDIKNQYGVVLNPIYNGTHGIGDFIQIAGEESGLITISSIRAAQTLRVTKGGYVVAHSQGTSGSRGMFSLLSPEMRKGINYQGFGGQRFIDADHYGLQSARNVRNWGDFIPFFSPANWNANISGKFEMLPKNGQKGLSIKYHGWENYSPYLNF